MVSLSTRWWICSSQYARRAMNVTRNPSEYGSGKAASDRFTSRKEAGLRSSRLLKNRAAGHVSSMGGGLVVDSVADNRQWIAICVLGKVMPPADRAILASVRDRRRPSPG